MAKKGDMKCTKVGHVQLCTEFGEDALQHDARRRLLLGFSMHVLCTECQSWSV